MMKNLATNFGDVIIYKDSTYNSAYYREYSQPAIEVKRLSTEGRYNRPINVITNYINEKINNLSFLCEELDKKYPYLADEYRQ